MSAVEEKPALRDGSLLGLALKRARDAQAETEVEVERAMSIAQTLADPEVAMQTVAMIGHLADRVRISEQNTVVLAEALQGFASDSLASREALLQALQEIASRLGEATPINLTVEQPAPGRREVSLERDSNGMLVGATIEDVPA
jgi:hypothetical protein